MTERDYQKLKSKIKKSKLQKSKLQNTSQQIFVTYVMFVFEDVIAEAVARMIFLRHSSVDP